MPRNPFLQFLLSLFMLKKHDDLLVLHKHGKHQNCHEQFNFAKNIAGSHVRGSAVEDASETLEKASEK